MNAITPSNPSDDDGFGGSHRSGRLIRGIRIAWNLEWTDADGCAPPAELVIVGIKRVLQKWKDGKPEVIDTFPLPDPELLNDAIPKNQWEDGLDGSPTPPWQHTVVAYAIEKARALTPTSLQPLARISPSINWTRRLKPSACSRGPHIMPSRVRLSERPMKTRWGTKSRPHFRDRRRAGGRRRATPRSCHP